MKYICRCCGKVFEKESTKKVLIHVCPNSGNPNYLDRIDRFIAIGGEVNELP